MPRLLVIDDEPSLRYSLVKSLQSAALEVVTAATARDGIEMVRQQSPDAVILDVRLPDMSGIEAFEEIRRIDPRLPVIIVTAFSTTETSIEAMKRGAFEYLLKPVDFRQLRELVAKAIGRVAPLDVPVLILGESGTGKELVARAIYQHSPRSQGPFLAINCAAIPEGMLESELFGHEKGSFTGADRRRIGKFEQADAGTLFLDEIADMTLPTQPKLLRLLQERQLERIGGDESIRTDVRVLAATNQDLDAKVATGLFRHDLLHRLKAFTIYLPPLLKRREDLPLLIGHFLKQLNSSLGKQVNSVAPEVMPLLEAYSWPGNVSELESVIKYAYFQSAGEVITRDCLPAQLRSESSVARPRVSETEADGLDVCQ
ncbi:MAG TPA: sigma-54 dependent transcriptional regulator [Planctomycetaceae bacterium]|jgi:two-component system nitrogen regulation response regulator GlnG|nr:sigma-54 dependent transcriptional regulator [Planctomycetaceae bacterium]